jgi:hypothetical protein
MWLTKLAPSIVHLPGGLVLDDGEVVDCAELRPLTGREEEWLARNPDVPSALAVTKLLSGCLLRLGNAAPPDDVARRLLVGDRDFLMLQLRAITLGDEFQPIVHCAECNQKMDISFKTNDVPVERRPQTATLHTLVLSGRGRRKRTVRFRLPTGADQEAVLALEPEDAVNTLLDRCLIDKPRSLGAHERTAIIDAMGAFAPKVELELDLQCLECKYAFVTPFDTTAFFLTEMRSNEHQLLKEFHGLAFYYHWSEAEILNLDRGRRRAYLSLLSDELGPN